MLAFLTGLFMGINFSFTASAEEPAHKYLEYFHKVYQIIRTDYVDIPETKNVFYGAIQGMIKSLDDPFSRFLDEKSFSDLKEMTTGKFVGVGIEITVRDGEVVVISPIDNSPAMHEGVIAGDVITRVNDKPIKGMKLSSIIKMIKGLPKTKVRFSIRREGYDNLLDYEIERAPIKIKSVEYSTISDTGIGYIKIKSFGSETSRDVEKALKSFNRQKTDRVIVDLRYNPGGLLTAAIKVSDLFLKKEYVIVSTRGRKGSVKERIFKSKNNPVYMGKLMVLVNKGSASASEIFSGAIRDNKRGKLIGEKTFGKGSVQKSFNLDERVGVAITIAKYYTPSGELIHKKGIKPDYSVPVKRFSDSDRENIRLMNKKKFWDKFVSKDMVYNSESKGKFRKFLKNNNIKLSSETGNLLLKNRIFRYKKRPLYDLEFDNQLVSAIGKITKVR